MNRRTGLATERACEVQPALFARVATRESRGDQPEGANRAAASRPQRPRGAVPSPAASTTVGTPVGPLDPRGMKPSVARLGLLATAALILATLPSPASAASPAPAALAASAAWAASPVETSMWQATAAARSPGPTAGAEPPGARGSVRSSAAGTAGVVGALETPSTGVWPLEPQPDVVSGFDPPLSTYGPGHRGVDLAGTAGQKVRAAAGGRVTYAGSLAGRGVVVVSHGTTRTTYEPVEAGVKRGSVVPAGAVIGTLQTFGSHCAPRVCLHWGLIEGEIYRDPLTLVGAGPVRLLPLVGRLPVADPGRGARSVGQEGAYLSPNVGQPVTLGGVPGGRPVVAGLW